MVNITKRLHKLLPKLWEVKGGGGAVILPPKDPAPQLTHLVLRIPNPCNGFDSGAHAFWRNYLPSLRYHNLTLPIQVEQKPAAPSDFAPTLTLQFEATTRAALANQKAEPALSETNALLKWKGELEKKRQSEMLAAVQGGPLGKKTSKPDSWVDQMRKQQEESGIPEQYKTKVGDITVKAQPAADPSAPSTTSPPPTVYQRSITLGLRGRRGAEIWEWFETLTGPRRYKMSREDSRPKDKFARYKVRAEKDRQRVKKGIDAMRREKEDLRRAKEAAERLTET